MSSSWSSRRAKRMSGSSWAVVGMGRSEHWVEEWTLIPVPSSRPAGQHGVSKKGDAMTSGRIRAATEVFRRHQ